MLDGIASDASKPCEIAALRRLIFAERGAASHDVATAERELRARAHLERETRFALRRRHNAKWDKFTGGMLSRARIAVYVGFLSALLGSMTALFIWYNNSGRERQVQLSLVPVPIVFSLLLLAGGIGFAKGHDWGRRVLRIGLLLACLGWAALFSVILIGFGGMRPHGFSLGLLLVAAAVQVLAIRDLGSLRCRVWCSLKIRRRVGHTNAELRAMNP
jgi:hypothetical protein